LDKKRLNRIFLLSTAGVLLLLGVIGALRAARPEVQTGPVIVEQAQPDTVSVETVDVTPAPTPEPITYENTVTLLVDRQPVMTLANELSAKQMLWEYLSASATAPQGETFVSAKFDCELILTQGDPVVKPLETGEALSVLAQDPSLVPILVTTLRTERSETSPEISESAEPALPKGERIIAQLGTGALSQTSVQAVYRAGVLLETSGAGNETAARGARDHFAHGYVYESGHLRYARSPRRRGGKEQGRPQARVPDARAGGSPLWLCQRKDEYGWRSATARAPRS